MTKNTADDVDTEIYSLPYFIELACKGETVTIDMLHAQPKHMVENRLWEELQSERQKFYTKDMRSYVGWCQKASR